MCEEGCESKFGSEEGLKIFRILGGWSKRPKKKYVILEVQMEIVVCVSCIGLNNDTYIFVLISRRSY